MKNKKKGVQQIIMRELLSTLAKHPPLLTTSSQFRNSRKISMKHEVFFMDSHQLSNWRLLLHTSDHHFSQTAKSPDSFHTYPCFQWPHLTADLTNSWDLWRECAPFRSEWFRKLTCSVFVFILTNTFLQILHNSAKITKLDEICKISHI